MKTKAKLLKKRLATPVKTKISKQKSLISLCFIISLIIIPLYLFAEENKEIQDQEAGFYYTIKKGDTLWDLSKRFSDSPWLWPDLWKENSQIPNPHWIYPGNRIRLFRKQWVKTVEMPVEEKTEIIKEEPVYYLYKEIDMVGFIRKEAIAPSAVIIKVKDDKKLISKDDVIYLRKEKGDFIPGSRHTIYRTLPPVEDPEKGEQIGIQHYILGIVEVIKEEPKFVVGKIISSFRPIQIEDKIMPYTKRSIKIPVISSAKGIKGNIICSEEHQNIFGDHTIAFFDKGKKDGINEGQIYIIFYQDKVVLGPDTKEKVELTPDEFGELFVLHAEDTASTAIITSSKDLMRPGAKIKSLE